MNPDWKLKAEFLEFSDWMPNVTKKVKITHNVYWRNWKKRVILTMIGKIMKCVWEGMEISSVLGMMGLQC